MSYLSLYRKWRPQTFADVLGQAHVTETFLAALREDRIAHAYLFSGPRGTGKTSTARILAKSLNCETGVTAEPCGECRPCTEIAEGSSLDVFEMDAASHTSVDDVREIRERIPFASAGGGRKVYIIDEAHQLSTPAFNALLKMLEEPPPHVIFVLCTTESHKLPATVVSRCQRFEFRRLSPSLVVEHLGRVSSAEGFTADEAALQLIARHARGSVRDALSLLDQAAGTADGTVTRRTILDILGEAPEDVLLDVAAAVRDGDVAAVFRRTEELIDQGWDPRQLLRQLLDHFRSLLLASRGAADLVDADAEHLERLKEVASSLGAAHADWALRVLGEAHADMRLSTHPRLTLEVALARACVPAELDPQALLARVERMEQLLAGGAPPPAAPAKPPAPAKRAEPEPAPQTPEEPAAPAPAVGADADLTAKWEAVLEDLRRRSRVAHTHLATAWPIEERDGELVAGFDKQIHLDGILKRPDKTASVAQSLEAVFGRKMRLRGELRPEDAPQPSEPAANGSGSGNGAAEASPVDLLVRGLGAEVVEEVDG